MTTIDTPTYDTLTTLKPPTEGKGAYARATLFGAVAVTDDRLDRLEHVLSDLNGVIKRAGAQLAPILTGGTYPDQDPGDAIRQVMPSEERSPLAESINGLATRADRLADVVGYMTRELSAILDAAEV